MEYGSKIFNTQGENSTRRKLKFLFIHFFRGDKDLLLFLVLLVINLNIFLIRW